MNQPRPKLKDYMKLIKRTEIEKPDTTYNLHIKEDQIGRAHV